METFSFSQDEISILLGVINKTIQQGGVGLPDAFVIVPIAQKLKDKLKPIPPPEEKKEEVPTPVFTKNN